MYGLPPSTEVRRPLPKAQLYKKFELKQSQRDAIDADIARMDFVNMIASQTVPSIAAGNEVKAIFVVEVELKRKEYDERSIALIAKLIPQQIIFALRYGDKVKLAVYYTKLFVTAWQQAEVASIRLDGLHLDTVWENIVRAIGNINSSLQFANSSLPKSLRDEIKADEERAKLQHQITALQRQMAVTKQPRRKRELFTQIQKLKRP